MARTLLLAATIVWLVAGVIGIVIGLTSAAGLQRMLPPLVIDLAALGGAVVAVGFGVLAIGLVHAGVVVACGPDTRSHGAPRSCSPSR